MALAGRFFPNFPIDALTPRRHHGSMEKPLKTSTRLERYLQGFSLGYEVIEAGEPADVIIEELSTDGWIERDQMRGALSALLHEIHRLDQMVHP